ncbi:flagellar hook-length control protein FliK [Nitratireductor rhodophyticola]|uniref:flagellar hook-length control protein FliK n=1 Tax=Nitratireductor rhodophyticola TaxID=2854036 RepID=UPI002AC8DFA6|nr:flagellar hook-length control protein FliK [Nitratireductor rhodophyticola]WPZ12670.1 flagellar hook-length control protein FliK [Nitratireductor rhodophyticola]
MNAAISRSLPATPQTPDTGLQKRVTGEAGSLAFEEALQENPKAKGAPEGKAGDEETGWHPIRWTLPHRMGGQEEAPRDGEQPADSIEISLPEDQPSDQMRAASPEAGDSPTPVAADPEAVEEDGQQARNNESRTAQTNGTPNAAPPVSEHAAAARHAAAGQPSPQANERARERAATVAPGRSERPLPEAAQAAVKAKAPAAEKPAAGAVEQQPGHSGKPETTQRVAGGNGSDGLLRDNAQQQQQPEIRVVSIQRAPAPVASSEQTPLAPRAGTSEAAHLQTGQQGEAGRMVQTLKIQLQPAELGMVTARLRIVGEQLTVDLQVENTEARHRLSTDSDSIVKALRSLGYDIDRVTVQQSASGGQSNTATGGNARDGAFQSMSDGRGEGDPSRGAGGERSPREQAGRDGRQAQDTADAAQNGLYI